MVKWRRNINITNCPHAWGTPSMRARTRRILHTFSDITMKLSKHLCLECSTCAIFLSSSFTVSIMALFLSKSLSETLIKAPFMLLFNLVISCIPSTKSLWKMFLLMYLLCHRRTFYYSYKIIYIFKKK